MSTPDFESQSRWLPDGVGRYTGRFDESWYQGRGVFGGLIAAAIVRAMEAELVDRERRVRSLTLHCVAPVRAAPGVLEVEVLRRGRHVTQLSARLRQEDATVAAALATFGRDRDHPLSYRDEAMPALPPPASVPVAPLVPMMPTFTQHVEYRFCHGALPLSGASEPRLGGWCRLRETPVQADAAYVAALLDVWPPPLLALGDQFPNSATVDLTMHFLAPLPLAGVGPEALYAFTHHSPTIEHGYAEQQGTLWTEDGVLVGRVRQLLATF